ncbi:hypothetical protein A3G69_05910 [Candidatus Peribacteria bacterium RIFCSPLOWO2_12_FULL_53_10]|nr:MAG: hypothetical protein A3G69_05910 [Candidatus Peribacteria bacterium RIFCSPLOWO2_12_FULL_53_10]
MTLLNIILGALLLIGLFISWKVSQKPISSFDLQELEKLRKDIQEARLQDRKHLQERMDYMGKLFTENSQETNKTVHAQLKQSHAIVREVTEKLTKIDETNRQVMNFSSQLEDLQRILKQPKGKGVFGEYWLATMLSHVLQPDQYKLQYAFQNGEIVDAVVFFQDKIIPIDAKFSSEKYSEIGREPNQDMRGKLEEEFKKDLKLRIDETAKYIRPEESTTDYAFMFIPAEGIYYDLLVSKVGTLEINRINLIQYAHNKRVLIVSPNTFFAFLQTVIEGIKAFKIQESVLDVLKRVDLLGKHLGSYDSFMKRMGEHMGTTVSMYNQAYGEFKKIDKDIYKLTDGEVGGTLETIELEKPTAHLEETFEKVSRKKLTEVSS